MAGRTIPVLLLLLLLTAGAVGDISSNVEEKDSFTARTATEKFTFEVAEGTTSARLKVVVRLEEGEADWQLRDPQGGIHIRGYGSGGRVITDTDDFTPQPGAWTLHLRMRRATGDYLIRWKARG